MRDAKDVLWARNVQWLYLFGVSPHSEDPRGEGIVGEGDV